MKYSEWPEDKKIRARASHNRWKERNRDKRSAYYKTYDANRTVAKKLHRSMLNRKVEYDISPTDIYVPTHCPICLVEMAISPIKGGSSRSFSLDTIIPNKGYVKGNIAVICKLCNSRKGGASAAELRRIADWIDAQFTSPRF